MKILVLASRFPYPLEKGDKLRLYHQLRQLAEQHEVVLLSLSDVVVGENDYAFLAQFCSKIYILPFNKKHVAWSFFKAIFKKMPFQIAYFYHSFLQKKIDKILADEQPDYLYCQLIRMSEYVRGQKNIPKILDYMDAFSAGMTRRSKQSNWLSKRLFNREARLLSRYEKAVLPDFEHCTIISEQDAQEIGTGIHILSNGVDTDFFQPFNKLHTPKYDLVFVGNMGYYPNVEAAKFLIQQVLPLLHQTHPHLNLLIAGARPSTELLALQSDTVTVSGWVEDIRTAYLDGQVFVAPLFAGSGQQNKILEAMAMGLPCVTTTMVNNAIGASNEKEILLADDLQHFKRHILFLVENNLEKEKIATQGQNFILKNYSWNAANQVLLSLLKKRHS